VRRRLSLVSLVLTGCLSSTHIIPRQELERLVNVPPEQRGEHVRVIQGGPGAESPPEAPRVGVSTAIIIAPGPTWSPPYRPQTAKSSSDDAKIWLAVAAIVAVTLIFTEGLRFDGYVRLNPMHPVHLFGPNGEWTWVPLAQLDPGAVGWAHKAFIRPSEGPWTELEHAPLDRVGFNYNLLLGTGEITGAEGTRRAGFLTHIELGYFPHPMFGILLDFALGWRTDGTFNDIFQSRWALEFQGLPLVARPLHAGVWAELGGATRLEDFNYPGVTVTYGRSSFLLAGGVMMQLELTARMALTGRAGIALLDDDKALEATIGVSIY
jgi:hypothetical protein